MFTGIIAKTGKVKKVTTDKSGMLLEIENKFKAVKLGDSINVNGVCSTGKRVGQSLVFEYMPESLKLSNLGKLKTGDVLNLEQSMKLGDRLDGHIVLGHIDGTGELVSLKAEGNSWVFEVKVPDKKFMKMLVYKGSVAVEGISLTVAEVKKNSFVVKIIPHTYKNTNLKFKKVGQALNLEFDILAKYAHANKK